MRLWFAIRNSTFTSVVPTCKHRKWHTGLPTFWWTQWPRDSFWLKNSCTMFWYMRENCYYSSTPICMHLKEKMWKRLARTTILLEKYQIEIRHNQRVLHKAFFAFCQSMTLSLASIFFFWKSIHLFTWSPCSINLETPLLNASYACIFMGFCSKDLKQTFLL